MCSQVAQGQSVGEIGLQPLDDGQERFIFSPWSKLAVYGLPLAVMRAGRAKVPLVSTIQNMSSIIQ